MDHDQRGRCPCKHLPGVTRWPPRKSQSIGLAVLCKTLAEPAARGANHHATHLPLARTNPGPTGYDISQGPGAGIGGPSGLQLVATLHFGCMADIGAAMAWAQGQAMAADVGNFASGGVEVMMFEEVGV